MTPLLTKAPVASTEASLQPVRWPGSTPRTVFGPKGGARRTRRTFRSEEHTSELQSQFHLVCRLLLEKKKEIHHGMPATQHIYLQELHDAHDDQHQVTVYPTAVLDQIGHVVEAVEMLLRGDAACDDRL